MSSTKKTVITAMLIAAGVVLPIIFHMVPAGWGGRVGLPMHIPVLLGGLLVGPFYGFFGGLITPLFSSMMTGMPHAGPAVYRMMIELSVYGLTAGFVMRWVHTKRPLVDWYISLVAAMLAGRAAAGLAQAFLLFDGNYNWGLWVAGYFTASLPGIVLQLVIIPVIMTALMRARLIPQTRNKKNERNPY